MEREVLPQNPYVAFSREPYERTWISDSQKCTDISTQIDWEKRDFSQVKIDSLNLSPWVNYSQKPKNEDF